MEIADKFGPKKSLHYSNFAFPESKPTIFLHGEKKLIQYKLILMKFIINFV